MEATLLICLTFHSLTFLSDAVERTECYRPCKGLDSKIALKIFTLHLSGKYLLFHTGLRLLNMADASPSLELIASYGVPSAVMMVPECLIISLHLWDLMSVPQG
jgi:hypothetical protein